MLLIIQPNDIHNKHSATDNTVAYFFDKKSLTTRFGLYGKIFIAQWKQKMNRLYKSGRFWDGNDAGVGTDQWII